MKRADHKIKSLCNYQIIIMQVSACQKRVVLSILWTILLNSASVSAVPIPSTRSIPPYELIPLEIDSDTGAVTLTCRDGFSGDELNVGSVSIGINRSANSYQDIRNISCTEVVGCCSIKFTLHRSLEGHYTCGRLEDGRLEESNRLTLICKLFCTNWYIPRYLVCY